LFPCEHAAGANYLFVGSEISGEPGYGGRMAAARLMIFLHTEAAA
jgi:hypothetical protein